jgi:hypothetical protein
MTMFSRGIGESALPTSPRWSTRARVLLPLDRARTECSLWVDSSPLQHGESSTTIYTMSWPSHNHRREITKLPIVNKPSR